MREGICYRQRYLVHVGVLAVSFAAAGALLHAQQAAPSGLPEGPGKELLSVACTQCHNLRPITMLRYGVEGWRNMVQEMVLRGAQLLPEEAETVAQYLAKNFGPNSGPSPGLVTPSKTASSGSGTAAGALAPSLPPGPGKELVESRCTACHGLDRITFAKRTREEWERVSKDMVELGTQVTLEEMQRILSYLNTQFGKGTN